MQEHTVFILNKKFITKNILRSTQKAKVQRYMQITHIKGKT